MVSPGASRQLGAGRQWMVHRPGAGLCPLVIVFVTEDHDFDPPSHPPAVQARVAGRRALRTPGAPGSVLGGASGRRRLLALVSFQQTSYPIGASRPRVQRTHHAPGTLGSRSALASRRYFCNHGLQSRSTLAPAGRHTVITVLPLAGRACAELRAAGTSSRDIRVIGGATMRPSATASATRSKSSLDGCKAKLMPVIPVAPRDFFISDVLSRHRATA